MLNIAKLLYKDNWRQGLLNYYKERKAQLSITIDCYNHGYFDMDLGLKKNIHKSMLDDKKELELILKTIMRG